jgi:urease accessory protein
VLHPLGGADHLLAMVTVGLWSALALPAGRRLAAPIAFAGAMLAAVLVARAGLFGSLGGVLEPLVAASVVVLGALLVGGSRVAPMVGLALTALAGTLHGAVHGIEAPSAPGAYIAGFVLTTIALHLAGLAAGPRLAVLHRWAGAAVGMAGIAMLVARV